MPGESFLKVYCLFIFDISILDFLVTAMLCEAGHHGSDDITEHRGNRTQFLDNNPLVTEGSSKVSHTHTHTHKHVMSSGIVT